MSDLVSRVLAAIEETERNAGIAHPGPWTIHRDNEGTFVTYGGENRIVGKVFAGYDARFIARNDPAAVLRRCASDRGLVDAYREAKSDQYLGGSNDRAVLAYEDGRLAGLWRAVKSVAHGYGISVEEETTGE